MGFGRTSIRLGMGAHMGPDDNVDFIVSVISLSVVNYFVYALNQLVGIIIFILLAFVTIIYILNKITEQDEALITSVMMLLIFNYFIYLLNNLLGIIIWILLAISIIGFMFEKKRQEKSVIEMTQSDEIALSDYNPSKEEWNCVPIPPDLLDDVCNIIGNISYKHRGIMINREFVKATMEILNASSTKSLPQNSRNAVKDKTPDGLDKRIKERLNSNLRTANIISDVLENAGIVDVIKVINISTGRTVKGTRLHQKWSW